MWLCKKIVSKVTIQHHVGMQFREDDIEVDGVSRRGLVGAMYDPPEDIEAPDGVQLGAQSSSLFLTSTQANEVHVLLQLRGGEWLSEHVSRHGVGAQVLKEDVSVFDAFLDKSFPDQEVLQSFEVSTLHGD